LKKNKISKNWINKQKKDIFVKQSKLEGYKSRAVYKLKEINEKFKILKNGMSVIDLGAAPGSWSQYLSKNIKNAKLLAIDLTDFEKIDGVKIITGDFTEEASKKKIHEYFGRKIDVVVSDMAKNTTGNKDLDSINTGELCIDALLFSKTILNTRGVFISKIFMGSSFKEIIDSAKDIFKEVNIYKPSASRKDSKENYIICKFLK